MAASKPVEPQSGTGLPRWQLALLIGTPIVLGAGALYLWKRGRTKETKGTGERKTPEGSASPVQGQDGAAPANQELEKMVPSRCLETGRASAASRAVTALAWLCNAHGLAWTPVITATPQSRTPNATDTSTDSYSHSKADCYLDGYRLIRGELAC